MKKTIIIIFLSLFLYNNAFGFNFFYNFESNKNNYINLLKQNKLEKEWKETEWNFPFLLKTSLFLIVIKETNKISNKNFYKFVNAVNNRRVSCLKSYIKSKKDFNKVELNCNIINFVNKKSRRKFNKKEIINFYIDEVIKMDKKCFNSINKSSFLKDCSIL